MSEDVKVIKSSLPDGENNFIPLHERMIINVTLPNGMIITDPEQFQNEEYEYIEDNSEFMEP